MLIGRDVELGRIESGLADTRLVTLAGPGGVGKTVLARAATAAWPPDAVLFAELADFADDDLDERIAGSLGFASFADLLAEAASRPWLLVLDNCEHVVDAAAGVATRLLDAGRGLRILATSRERLDLPGELCVRVDPLPTDGSPSPAAQLFREAAARRGAVLADDPAATDELCRRLDGLPLALELAAARAATMTAAEMLSHLDAHLDLLARSRPRGPERHRSLGATVGWSYQQLDDGERATFERLAVFAAPFTVDMAGAVTGNAAALPPLVERSLLVHPPHRGTSWYRMLETIRAFAEERLDASGDRPGCEERYHRHLESVADRLDRLGAAGDFAMPRELGCLYGHLHQGIDRAIARDNAASAARLAAPLWWLEDVGHQSEAADLLERAIRRWPDPAGPMGDVYGIVAGLQRTAGRQARSREAAELAAAGTGLGAAYGRRALGQHARVAGRWEEALEHFAVGSAAARGLGAEWLACEIESHAALTEARAGRIDDAVARLESVLAVTADMPINHAWATNFLAYVSLTVAPPRAAALAGELLAVGESVDDPWIIGSARDTLALAALVDGDPAAAATHVATAIERFASIRNRTDITLALEIASVTFAQLGDHAVAAATHATRRRYSHASFGGFEAELFDRLGPLLAEDPAPSPLAVDEVARRLRNVPAPAAPEAPRSRWRRSGDAWLIAFAGSEIHQRHSKGLADLAELLARPGQEIAALDLMDAGVVGGDAGPASDAAARRRYQERIRELQAQVDAGDPEAKQELDALVDHLTAAYGLGGRDRAQGQPAEKARSAVTWRIRTAIKRIAEVPSALADHLDRSVRTGRFCVYDPAKPVDWEF